MITLELKFESEAAKDSFVGWFLDGGGEQEFIDSTTLVNTVEADRGNSLFFTKKLEEAPVEAERVPPESVASTFVEDVQSASDAGLLDGQDVDLSESSTASSPATAEDGLDTTEESTVSTESEEEEEDIL